MILYGLLPALCLLLKGAVCEVPYDVGLGLGLGLDLPSALAATANSSTPKAPRRRTPPQRLTDRQWRAWVEQGCNLVKAMDGTDAEAAGWLQRQGTAESEFVTFPDDLLKWGYDENTPMIQIYYEEHEGPIIDEALAALGADSRKENRGGPNVVYPWEHVRATTHGDVEYPATEASFRTIINAKDGIIVGWYKYGPRYSGARRNPPVYTLPRLKNWHDISFLAWKDQVERRGKPMRGLRYIFSAPIANYQTRSIALRAMFPDGGVDEIEDACPMMLVWRNRRTFLHGTDEFKALLGSPNGRGAALILITHKGAFGPKTRISSVSLFCGYFQFAYELNLAFAVDYSGNDAMHLEGSSGHLLAARKNGANGPNEIVRTRYIH